MKNLGKYLLIAISATVITLILWVILSLTAAKQDFYVGRLSRRDSAEDVKEAFTIALWLHSDVAYEITDASLWGELDKWMDSHVPRDCSIFDPGQLDSITNTVNPDGANYYFSCDVGDLALDNVAARQDSSGRWYITHWEVDP